MTAASTPALAQERFWAKVEMGPVAPALGTECWLWTASKIRTGYGHVKIQGRTFASHIVSWQWLRGWYPPDLEFDHLCRVRHCVNPWHLEPVTHAVNVARVAEAATHCKRGHVWTEDNTYRWRGIRTCRTCKRSRRAHANLPAISG